MTETRLRRAAQAVVLAAKNHTPEIAELNAALAERREVREPELGDEQHPAWLAVEKAIWPRGPASGTGSGVYAALKARVCAALRTGREAER